MIPLRIERGNMLFHKLSLISIDKSNWEEAIKLSVEDEQQV